MEAGKQARKYGNRSSQIQGKWGHADVRNEDQGEREREKNPEVFLGVFSHQQDGRGNTLYQDRRHGNQEFSSGGREMAVSRVFAMQL